MSRAHYVENVLGVSGSGALSLMAGATVHVYDEGTTDHIAQTIYDSDSGGGTLSNPLTSDANGKVEFWLATAARVDLAVSKVGFTSQTRTVDVEDAPSGYKTTHFTREMLLDLHNTAVDLWPAPAADAVLLPRRIITRFVPATESPVDYEFDPGTSFLTYYGTASATGSADTAFLPLSDQTGCIGTLTSPVPGGSNGGPTSDYAGQPLRLKLDLPLTSGNGTLDVTVVVDVI